MFNAIPVCFCNNVKLETGLEFHTTSTKHLNFMRREYLKLMIPRTGISYYALSCVTCLKWLSPFRGQITEEILTTSVLLFIYWCKVGSLM